MVDVSVIILNYNTYELTSECIASVYEQTKDVTFEVIVVDNNSTDRDPTAFLKQFPNIILVRSEVNLGFSRGINLGLQHATGNNILLLNSDTRLLNNAVLLAHRALEADAGVAVVAGKLVYADNRPHTVAYRFPSIIRLLSEVLRLYHFIPATKRETLYFAEYFNHNRKAYPDWVTAAFFLVRRDVIDQLPEGKLPTDFFMYVEDKLWCYHINKLGYKVAFIPEPLILHHESASDTITNNREQKAIYVLTNEYIFTCRTRGSLYARLYFALQALHHLTTGSSYARATAKIFWKIALRNPQKELPLFSALR